MNTLKISNSKLTVTVTNIDKHTDANTGISFCTGTAKLTTTGKPENGILSSVQVTGVSVDPHNGWRGATKDMIAQAYSILETYTANVYMEFEPQ